MHSWAKLIFAVAIGLCAGTRPAAAIEPLVNRYGLGTVLHPIQDVPKIPYPLDFKERCQCRNEQVHIFGVNGLNPLCSGNFNGLCDMFRERGFSKTTFDQLYTCDDMPVRIRAVRKADPDARIVLVGFSLGCNSVRSIANELAGEGVKIDLMIYLVGDHIRNDAESKPANVSRLVNVRAKGLVLSGGDLFFNGADLDGARNVKLQVRHILVPSRRETQELCLEEILTMMCRPAATK